MNIDKFKEQMDLFELIQEKLKQPFPEGTVISDPVKKSAYIPAQAYIKRLNQVAGPLWSWERTGEVAIHERENQLELKGILTIMNAKRSGTGFSNFERYNDTGKIKNIKSAVRSANSDAIRAACDMFEMGWIDLKEFRSWAKNPGVGLSKTSNGNPSPAPAGKQCVRCQEPLTKDDMATLKEYNIDINFCGKHIPDHMFRHGQK